MEQQLTMVLNAAAMVAAQAKDIQVQSEGDLSEAVGFLGRVKSAKDSLEEQRTWLVKPLNDHVKNINAIFKSTIGPLEEADRLVRSKVAEWKRAEQARIAEQERLAREAEAARQAIEAACGEVNDEQIAVLNLADRPDVPIKQIHTDGGSASFRKVWTFEITNEADIPREYLVVDLVKLRMAVRNGAREIPGVRIFEEDQLAVSGGRL